MRRTLQLKRVLTLSKFSPFRMRAEQTYTSFFLASYQLQALISSLRCPDLNN